MANFFKSFFNFKVFPTVRAQDEEEELVDPQQALKDKCNEDHHIKPFLEKYQACNDRVNSRSKTTETCVEELFDYLHHLDDCVSKTLFAKLK